MQVRIEQDLPAQPESSCRACDMNRSALRVLSERCVCSRAEPCSPWAVCQVPPREMGVSITPAYRAAANDPASAPLTAGSRELFFKLQDEILFSASAVEAEPRDSVRLRAALSGTGRAQGEAGSERLKLYRQHLLRKPEENRWDECLYYVCGK